MVRHRNISVDTLHKGDTEDDDDDDDDDDNDKFGIVLFMCCHHSHKSSYRDSTGTYGKCKNIRNK
jgi:hypothetical protein